MHQTLKAQAVGRINELRLPEDRRRAYVKLLEYNNVVSRVLVNEDGSDEGLIKMLEGYSPWKTCPYCLVHFPSYQEHKKECAERFNYFAKKARDRSSLDECAPRDIPRPRLDIVVGSPSRSPVIASPKPMCIATVVGGDRPFSLCQHIRDVVTRFRCGVPCKDRHLLSKTYTNCFIGREAVDWLVLNTRASDKEDALLLGQALLEANLFSFVNGDHPFEDGQLYYKFSPACPCDGPIAGIALSPQHTEVFACLGYGERTAASLPSQHKRERCPYCGTLAQKYQEHLDNCTARFEYHANGGGRSELAREGKQQNGRTRSLRSRTAFQSCSDDVAEAQNLLYSFLVSVVHPEGVPPELCSQDPEESSTRSRGTTAGRELDSIDAEVEEEIAELLRGAVSLEELSHVHQEELDALLHACLGAEARQPYVERRGSGYLLSVFNTARELSKRREDAGPCGDLKEQDVMDDIPFVTCRLSDIEVNAYIGSGAYGQVAQGVWRGENVAVKRLNITRRDSKEYHAFVKEAAVLSALEHPNCVSFRCACVTPPDVCLVTEYIAGGDLHDLLYAPLAGRFDEGDILRQTACGMAYLHSRHVIHRDLKPGNVLLTPDLRVKIADYGLAKVNIETIVKTQCGTPSYMAPEVLADSEYGEKADVYSFGVLSWEVMARAEPYAHKNYTSVFDMIGDILENGARPGPMPIAMSASLTQTIDRSLDHNPAARPSFEELILELEYV